MTGQELSEEIEFVEVTKVYSSDTKPAVDHVSFRVAAGSFVVLLGPSGCGKTTLLKMVNRLYEPTSGQVFIGGTEVHDLHPIQLRRRIGYVIQQVGLFPHMTIAENIAVVPRLMKWKPQVIEERINYLLEMVDLPQSYCKRYPRQLSGGEQQRVGLARALAADPRILLMDEPFAAIDAINRESLQKELYKIHRKVHKSVLFVTHDVEEAFRLADQIVVMRAGRVIQYGTPLAIVTRPQDEFVQELVDTNNVLRRLSLLTVQSVLDRRGSAPGKKEINSMPVDGALRVHPQEDLRSVLSKLLSSGSETLAVVDEKGRLVGRVSLSDVRMALANYLPQTQERV